MAREHIYCLLCDKKVGEFHTTFFTDAGGMQRYGSVCKKCYKEGLFGKSKLLDGYLKK